MNEFQEPIHAPLFMNKVLYCSINNLCKIFYTIDSELRHEDVHELYGDHSEADTRMMLHAVHAVLHNFGNIVVRANDADVIISLLSSIHHIENSHL